MDGTKQATGSEPQTTELSQKNNQLSIRQLLFINEYIQLQAQGTRGAGAKAAIKAGYSKKGASSRGAMLLKNKSITHAVGQAQEEASASAGTSTAYIYAGLKKEAERTGEGSSHAARVQAYIALGKTQGMFEADNKQRRPVQFTIINRGTSETAKPQGKVIDVPRTAIGQAEAPSFMKADPLAMGGTSKQGAPE